MLKIISPHELPANIVFRSDVPRMLKDAEEMIKLCRQPLGLYPNAIAIAHPQVEGKSPLAFFVTATGAVIVNPKIVRHVNYTNPREEGCYSYANLAPVQVHRWPKIEVSYESIVTGELQKITKQLRGFEAQVFQHEVEHLLGIDIYHKSV